MNKNNKNALLLNNVDSDSITTVLYVNNYTITSKFLNSSVNNWKKICEMLENDNVLVIGKFTESVLLKMCDPYYEEVTTIFLERIRSKKHIIFLYKDNMKGILNYYNNNPDNDEEYSAEAWEELIQGSPHFATSLSYWLYRNNIDIEKEEYFGRVQKLIRKIITELNVSPYEKITDINISGQFFIENIIEGLLLKIAIPNDRLWSNEFDKFITLFRDYVSFTSKEELKIIQNRTNTGVLYSIYSTNENINVSNIDAIFNNFSVFMDICVSAPDTAKNIIDNLDLAPEHKIKILKKYLKEAQRLSLDLKQERESKILSIKHRLEIDLQEHELSKDMQEYIDNSVPRPNISNFLALQSKQAPVININPIFVDKVDGIVCSEINGTVNQTTEDKMLIDFFKKLSENIAESITLQTALYELNDKSSSKESKRSSWQKISTFLVKAGDKIGDVGVVLLTKYLEQKMGL